MQVDNLINLLSIAVTLLLFLLPMVYFAGKMIGKIETLIGRVTDLEGKVEKFQSACFTKSEAGMRMQETDGHRAAMWKSIDKLKKDVIRLFMKAGIDPED